MMLGSQQAAMLGMAPSACFAKYTRSKPHLNVGTIGTSSFSIKIGPMLPPQLVISSLP